MEFTSEWSGQRDRLDWSEAAHFSGVTDRQLGFPALKLHFDIALGAELQKPFRTSDFSRPGHARGSVGGARNHFEEGRDLRSGSFISLLQCHSCSLYSRTVQSPSRLAEHLQSRLPLCYWSRGSILITRLLIRTVNLNPFSAKAAKRERTGVENVLHL